MQMNVTIDMEEYTEISLADQIACEVARTYIGQSVRENIKAKVEAAVKAEIDEGIKGKVDAILEEMISKGVPKTNNWGEPTGEMVSVRDSIIQQADRFMKEKVNSRGEKEDYHNSGMNRVDWYIKKYAQDGLDKAIKAQIDAIKGEAVNSVKDTVAKLMAEKLTKKCDPVAF